MKKVLLFTVAVSLLIACSGGDAKKDPNSITLPTEAQVGELTDYVTFSKELKIKLKEEQKESTAEEGNKADGDKLKFVTTVSLEVKEAVASNNGFSFILSVVDADYTEIVKLQRFRYDYAYDDDVKDFHCILSKGIMRNDVEIELTPQEWENIKTNGAYIIIKQYDRYVKFKTYREVKRESIVTSSETEDDNISSSNDSPSVDFDELLDSYEKYVDKYISLMRKAKNGDASAMSEYPDLLEEANELSSKIKNVQGELTSSQLSRYTKISNKMLKAAQEMQ